jgi:hypothetical protein
MFNAFQRTNQWPDGRSLLEQPSLTVDIFNVIDSQINSEQKKDRQSRGKRR